MKAALPLLASTLALTACVSSSGTPAPAPAPVARPAPAPAPAPPPPIAQAVPSQDWMDAPLTPGTWRYQDFGTGMGKRALFADPGNTFYFSLDCVTQPNGPEILFTRTGRLATGSPVMVIRTETMQRALTAQRLGAEITAVAVPASDPLLDAMALSKGRFAVEVEGEAPLYLPSYAEVTRVIEDCR